MATDRECEFFMMKMARSRIGISTKTQPALRTVAKVNVLAQVAVTHYEQMIQTVNVLSLTAELNFLRVLSYIPRRNTALPMPFATHQSPIAHFCLDPLRCAVFRVTV